MSVARFFTADESEKSIEERRAWRLIRRHLVGEPRLMRVLELHFLGVVDPRVIGAALGVESDRALALCADLLSRLQTTGAPSNRPSMSAPASTPCRGTSPTADDVSRRRAPRKFGDFASRRRRSGSFPVNFHP